MAERNLQTVKWGVDLALGITLLVTFVTGLFKWTLLMQTLGLTDLVLPIAVMSVLHDWAGFLLGCFVLVHLYLNRAWILTMTRRILAGK
ncbi:MAG: DUF4405 domain-containing protein [Methanoregula sp.]|jgi:cytochrome b subunit of formate dehydrogenase|uniref:DUF4405 domain-containing protein n=1 Tax=Methanoregula sp. TaxID=2052170 RepID=UPI003D150248